MEYPASTTNPGITSNYKDFLLTKDTKRKQDKEYGMQMARYIQSTIGPSTNGYYFLRNERFKQNILWASGKMNVYAKFADQLQLNGKTNYVNIRWSAPLIINRIECGLVGRWMQRLEKIQVTATDPLSVKDKQNQYEQAEFVLYNRKQLEQLQQESGVPMIAPDQFVAEDKDELEEWAIAGSKTPEEIKYEMGTNDILESQGWFDALKDKCLRDSAQCGLVSAYVWMDEYGLIHIEWIKPLNAFYSYSEYDDFRDTAYRGFVKSMKVSELRRKYSTQFGGDLTEEEIFKIAQTAKEYQRYDKLMWTNEWNLAYIRPYDEWNVECIYFWLKSVDEDGMVVTKTKQNKSTLLHRSGRPIKLDENQEYVEKDKWNLYKGVYVREANVLLEWGVDNNLIRPQDPKESGNVEFPLRLYMYQNQDMRNVALPEKIEEPVEQMILARLKIQQLVAKMKPIGSMINIDAMQEVNLGLSVSGEVISPKKYYDQTGDFYYRGRDAEGNPIPVPIQELQNSGFVAQLTGLIQLYEYHYKVLKDELGEDPALITQAVQPRVTSENVQASQQQADYATDYMYDAYRYLLEDIAKCVACLLNNSVRFGAKAYRHIMQEQDVADRQFSTKFKLLPDSFEIQKFEAMLNQQIASNPEFGVYVDSFKLLRIAKEDVKLAEVMYRNAMKKMLRTQQQQKQQDVENNAQAQQQSAQLAAQAQKQIQDEKLSAEKELVAFKAQEDMKLEIIRGAFQIAAKSENPQMPTWLTPILNQLIPGITIPLAQQNQMLVQGAMAQNAQQQQGPQEAMQEGESQGQEMQEQQQMQPQ